MNAVPACVFSFVDQRDRDASTRIDTRRPENSRGGVGWTVMRSTSRVLLVDDRQDAERNDLDELVAALHIDPHLQVYLDQQAKGAAA
jgi:hypothetical protein